MCHMCLLFFERLIQNLRRRLHSKLTLPTWSMPVGREGLGCAPRRCPLRASTAAGHRKFLPRLPSTLSLTWKILESWLVEVSVETASTASTNNFKKKWSSLMFSVLEFGSTIVMQLPSDLPRDQGICPVRNQCIFKATYGHMATTPPTEFSETL